MAGIRRISVGRIGLVVALVVIALVLPAVPGSTADSVQLTPVRIVGGPGHAGLYGWGAATMRDGSVLITDYWNFRVQHFNMDGTLRRTAVANDLNHQAPFGVAVDPRNDTIYVSDTDGGRNIDVYDPDGTYRYSFGNQQTFKYPSWLDVDRTGRIAVADGHDNKIVVFNDQGQKLYHFGGPGTAPGQLKNPRGVGFDANNDLYVIDVGNKRIQVFRLGASSAMLLRSWAVQGDWRGLAVDENNNWVYVVNNAKGTIDKFDLYGNPLASWGGWGRAPGKFLDGGRGITVDGEGNVWVGDMPNFRAQKFSPTGEVLQMVPDPAQPPVPGGFTMPNSAALDANGNIFVVDTYNFRVQKLGPDGSFLKQWGYRGGINTSMGFNYSRGIAVDRRDGSVYVSDTDNSTIKKYTNEGGFLWARPGYKAFHLDVAPDGTLYLADFATNQVRALTPAGNDVGSFGGTNVKNPRGIGVAPDGSVWVANRGTGTIAHFSAGGSFLGEVGTANKTVEPGDVVSDGDRVYLADANAGTIKVWSKDGTFLGAFGGAGVKFGKMRRPMGLDITPAGRLYVTEAGGERIHEWAIE